MATISQSFEGGQRDPMTRERTFYFRMSLVFLIAAIAGFGFFFAIGVSSFHSPWWVHTHAVTMVGFLGLYVMQTWLVARGDLALHRRLGILVAGWCIWLVAFGCWTITRTIAQGRIAPFFTPSFFLMMDWLNMAVFAALAGSALLLRMRSDWHKRLMFGAMLSLMSVAWGRLILPQFFDQRAIVLVLVVLLAHLGVAMRFDRRVHGQVHPAHYWTGGALLVWIAVTFTLAGRPSVIAYASSFAG
ncbi:hypothetical protein [Novosphingobium sp. Gsoil 351]|uniref:hypothetical protein n=1 Tax=Novosphingobium sp. Gsoil 351 TaxID=2675225 RepID=UPI0012B48CAD|nr:hypothetical protein [Novosphingobium sp. Gsoil 351]QGN54963.1 hypothetical protein GKE62_10765 [Novosphingobium sp. Gsoil 351]